MSFSHGMFLFVFQLLYVYINTTDILVIQVTRGTGAKDSIYSLHCSQYLSCPCLQDTNREVLFHKYLHDAMYLAISFSCPMCSGYSLERPS